MPAGLLNGDDAFHAGVQGALELEDANFVHLGEPGALTLGFRFWATIFELHVVGHAFFPDEVQRIALFDFKLLRLELQFGHADIDGLARTAAELGLSLGS